MDATVEVPEAVDQTSALLPGDDDYARYYSIEDRAFGMQMDCLRLRSSATGDTFESTFMQDMLQRLRYTTAALRMKNAFPGTSEARGNLHIDLLESGFPNHFDIAALEGDLVDRDSRLKDLPPGPALDEEILKCMLSEGEEPTRLLAARAERAYLEMLDEKKLFLPFTLGQLVPWQQKNVQCRGYIVSWACYDHARNMPFLYIMYMEQDLKETPFEEKGDNLAKFFKVLSTVGSYAPDQLSVFATDIDNALDPIHPKLIKRVRIGPLYTPLLIEARPKGERSDIETTMLDLFTRSGCKDDFVLMFNEELISSISQVAEGGFFKKVVREVFVVPPLDPDATEAGATRVVRYVIMPHRLLQVMRAEEREKIPRWQQRVKFSYNQSGEINEVG